VAKWNNISAISQPENKISYSDKVKRFAADAWERKQNMSQMEPNNNHWRDGKGSSLRGSLVGRGSTDRDQPYSQTPGPGGMSGTNGTENPYEPESRH